MKISELQTYDAEAYKQLLKLNPPKTSSIKKLLDEFLLMVDAIKFYNVCKDIPVRQLTFKLLVVHIITLLEVYLKQLIVERSKKWKQEGINALLKEKIPLAKAYELIGEAQISKIELINHFTSFNSIEAIDTVFSTLTQTPFIDTIKALRPANKDHIKRLQEAFKVRNKIVHENLPEQVEWKSVMLYTTALLALAVAIYSLFNKSDYEDKISN